MAKQNAIAGYMPNRITWKKDFERNKLVYLLFLPILVYFIIFNYIPMVGVLMAFEDYKVNKGLFASKWVG